MLELINEFSKVARYKINIQKSVALLYTNNQLSEREIKKPFPGGLGKDGGGIGREDHFLPHKFLKRTFQR